MKYLSYVYSILFLVGSFSRFLFFSFEKAIKNDVWIVLSLVEAFDKQGTGVYASGAAGQCCRMDLGEDKEILSLPWSFPPASTIFPLSSLSGPTIIALMHVWLNRAASLQRQCAAAEYNTPNVQQEIMISAFSNRRNEIFRWQIIVVNSDQISFVLFQWYTKCVFFSRRFDNEG